uniref:Uncharacterized protein n=1 Tax=Ascaris lumbricoides TaxID=6252 RepID=A0A0M3I9M5_ASCLU
MSCSVSSLLLFCFNKTKLLSNCCLVASSIRIVSLSHRTGTIKLRILLKILKLSFKNKLD